MTKKKDSNCLDDCNNNEEIIPDWSDEYLSQHPWWMLNAIANYFSHDVKGCFVLDKWHLNICSLSNHTIEGTLSMWSSVPQNYLLAIAAITDAIFLVRSSQEINSASDQRTILAKLFYAEWNSYLQEIEFVIGKLPPYSIQELHLITHRYSSRINDLLTKVFNALNKYVNQVGSEVIIDEQLIPLDRFESNTAFVQASFYGAAIREHNNSPLVNHLKRAISRGSTVLLIGSTGVGKTESVKEACLAEQALLVKVNGHPGLDDRALFGSTYPDDQGGFAYVEGPLSEAWRYAAEGNKVVLLIDELLRLDPYYHALLIGALDSLLGKEIKARPKVFTQVNKYGIIDEERYYLLSLPNGINLAAPIAHLSLICTTNLGSNYIQASSQFDSALLRRFQIQLDVKRLDQGTRVIILRQQQGLPKRVAEVMVDMEDFSCNHTATQGSLLREEANLGVLVNWGLEARSLFLDGAIWSEALLESAKTTLIPFICPRLSDGYLESPAVEMILDELKRLVKSKLNYENS